MSQNEATISPQPEQPMDGQTRGDALSEDELDTVAGGIIGTNGLPVHRPIERIERPESTLLKGGGG